ncbi:hypothetical protein [Amycolatopsis aidingensis]|uniref:hypothetical protein n=1 Tax=Amycolatopsis aidingensis TaxID=2842453 RepID=UPI001C0E566B|nr:hypothetical protein [Amycolatopsis aidingensis]
MGTIDEATAEHGGTPIFAAIRDEFGFTPPSQEPSQQPEAPADGSTETAEASGSAEETGEAEATEEEDEPAGRHRGA